MPPVPTAESETTPVYTKKAGDEPLPGYRLLAPLGRGGFGEVWKCEAPGGLHKAIKFVASESEDGRGHERFGQELAAFEQIKAIRHPFLLTLERVEQVGHELVMVMELADRQLQDRFRECRAFGLPGIPRDELLAYFADAAEALDVIAAKYHLQHLDIKPANLFLVGGHVKVGDYGLVAQLEGSDAGQRGLTPRYVAPEVLQGVPSPRSDQYSLALVYHELLIGEFPYSGRTPQQLMLQHLTSQPDLSGLPLADQGPVARALAKDPADRFPSCTAFVQALMNSGANTMLPGALLNVRRVRLGPTMAGQDGHGTESSTAALSLPSQATPMPLPQRRSDPDIATRHTHPLKPPLTVSDLPRPPLPQLVPAARPSGEFRQPPSSRMAPVAPASPPPAREFPCITPGPSPASTTEPPLAEEVGSGSCVVLDRIRSVVPLAALQGHRGKSSSLDPRQYAQVLVEAAAAGGRAPQLPGDIGWLADGTLMCRFPTTVPHSVVRLKLAIVHDIWGVSVEQPEPTRLVLRRTQTTGGFFSSKKFGYEVIVQLPPLGHALGEVTVFGRTFGPVDAKYQQEAHDILPKLITDVRTQLANVPDRRKYPRIACELPLTVYPLHSDGRIDAPMAVIGRDVSLGGVGLVSTVAIPTKYAYAVYTGNLITAHDGILIKLLRVQTVNNSRHYGAQYRTDL
ncbi:MAG: serine/threonine-protein kinase [Gemmataceae bacterium]|nr:serine/threonine-protein kinase [Gemmata sp.]MDW8197212.1 serine/threonine-protein kinase [Gemmataceae bacterium]